MRLRICLGSELKFEEELNEPLELGRQNSPSDAPLFTRVDGKLIIAPATETSISRRQVVLSPRGSRLHVKNISTQTPVGVAGGSPIPPGGEAEFELPRGLFVGSLSLFVDSLQDDEPERYQTLQEAPAAPGDPAARTQTMASMVELSRGKGPEWLTKALGALSSLVHSTAEPLVFFHEVASTMAELVGLDNAAVLLKSDGQWRIAALANGPQTNGGDPPGDRSDIDSHAWRPSTSILNHLEREKRTCARVPPQSHQAASLVDVTALVASPILDRAGQIVGAVYGDRRLRGGDSRISLAEMKLTENMAGFVAAALARAERDRELAQARVRFEQFFTTQLAEELANDPTLLEGRDADVTLLFCDIRGFSRVSEQLSPRELVEWVGDVMDALSQCVLRHDGVLVDYIGDELMAMWGAPSAQADHAQLACRAALEMRRVMPEISRRWRDRLRGVETRVGIGINSGPARVGNTGSSLKFKYGPLGNTVNLASRVQGATKYFRAELLATGETVRLLSDEARCRRLGKVRVVNIQQPVELFELAPEDFDGWTALKNQYEAALNWFYEREFRKAAMSLSALLQDFPDDGPTLMLLSKVVRQMNGMEAHCEEFELPGK